MQLRKNHTNFFTWLGLFSLILRNITILQLNKYLLGSCCDVKETHSNKV